MTGPSHPFSIAASTSKVDVNNNFPLKLYYRTADNLLKQASIYREERNIVELYILLLRFSSLVGETIPEHQSYQGSSVKARADFKRKLGQVLTELEVLKPEVQKRVEQINKKFTGSFTSDGFASSDYEWPPVSKSSSLGNFNNGTNANNTGGLVSNGARVHSSGLNDWRFNSPISSVQLGDQLSNLSLNLPRPRDETLSRHSFLGPNGLHGRRNLPIFQARVQYPTYVDASPIEIPSLDQSWDKPVSIVEDPMSLVALDSKVPMTAMDSKAGEPNMWMESDAMAENTAPKGNVIRQPSPPPVAAPVQKLSSTFESVDPVPPSSVADPRPGPAPSLEDELTQTKRQKYVHVSTQMMEEFLKLARYNTNKNLETCGVLAGSLKKGIFFVTTLIIPKQQATSDSCQTVNEEEIFDCQDKRGLFQLGWIHTHPTQSCFMSSVDLHTHYSYQVMLPEAIAIVMAPTDSSRKYGIFRLSDPGGVKAIQQCQLRGFHPHEQPPDGSPIYEHGSHVLMNPSLVVEVIDLR